LLSPTSLQIKHLNLPFNNLPLHWSRGGAVKCFVMFSGQKCSLDC